MKTQKNLLKILLPITPHYLWKDIAAKIIGIYGGTLCCDDWKGSGRASLTERLRWYQRGREGGLSG